MQQMHTRTATMMATIMTMPTPAGTTISSSILTPEQIGGTVPKVFPEVELAMEEGELVVVEVVASTTSSVTC